MVQSETNRKQKSSTTSQTWTQLLLIGKNQRGSPFGLCRHSSPWKRHIWSCSGTSPVCCRPHWSANLQDDLIRVTCAPFHAFRHPFASLLLPLFLSPVAYSHIHDFAQFALDHGRFQEYLHLSHRAEQQSQKNTSSTRFSETQTKTGINKTAQKSSKVLYWICPEYLFKRRHQLTKVTRTTSIMEPL